MTTRSSGNPDFHEVPPHCAECGQFVGELAVWERNDNWDLPDSYSCRCIGCATELPMEEHGFNDRDEARRTVLGAISG